MTPPVSAAPPTDKYFGAHPGPAPDGSLPPAPTRGGAVSYVRQTATHPGDLRHRVQNWMETKLGRFALPVAMGVGGAAGGALGGVLLGPVGAIGGGIGGALLGGALYLSD